METETKQVFVLLRINLERKEPPQSVVFDALPKLHQHAVDMVVKKIEEFNERHRAPLLLYARHKMYDKFFDFWRYLQKENMCAAGFDLHWEEEPQVVL